MQNFCLQNFNRYLEVYIKKWFHFSRSKHFSTPLSSASDSFVGTLGIEVDCFMIMTNYPTSRKLIKNTVWFYHLYRDRSSKKGKTNLMRIQIIRVQFGSKHLNFYSFYPTLSLSLSLSLTHTHTHTQRSLLMMEFLSKLIFSVWRMLVRSIQQLGWGLGDRGTGS